LPRIGTGPAGSESGRLTCGCGRCSLLRAVAVRRREARARARQRSVVSPAAMPYSPVGKFPTLPM
jgi:hypothetical protein